MKKILWLALSLLLVPPGAGAGSEAVFDHTLHVEDNEMACEDCHSAEAGGLPYVALMPAKELCLDCHDEDALAALPRRPSSHAGDFRHFHQFDLRGGSADCALCHRESEGCTLCHHGENVDFLAHDRNWFYDHALAGRKGTMDCAACHDVRSYCSDCHHQFGIEPGNHFDDGWSHSQAAREDLGACMLCHGGSNPSCAKCDHN